MAGDPKAQRRARRAGAQHHGRADGKPRDVVDLLALGEPLPLDALSSLTEPGAVEDAEQRGLVRIVGEPRLAARLAHPLYGEVRRTEIGLVRARRLRGLIATAIAGDDESARFLAVTSGDRAGKFFADFAASVPAGRPFEEIFPQVAAVTGRHGVSVLEPRARPST